MAKIVYPLAQVLVIKKRRVDEAEKVVQEKKKLLNQEEKRLKKAEAERDEVKEHHNAKLQQLRDELDQGTTTNKIQQMKDYLKIVQEKLRVEEKKVEEQKKQVEKAKKNLEDARKVLQEKRQELDKLETHKEEWEKKKRKELLHEEAKRLDEVGSLTYLSNRRRKQIELEQNKKRKK